MDLRMSRSAARDALSAASYDPKKLTLIHTGAALLLSLVLTILNLVLNRGIDTTGGLSGIGARSVLQVIQVLLSIASSALLPFWEIGFLYACIRYARREAVGPASLAEGFRRFGPVLRLFLLEMALYILLGFACMYASAILFSLTPFFPEMVAVVEPLMSETAGLDPYAMDAATTTALMKAAIPMYVIFGILFLCVTIPLSYRLRMARFSVMDGAPGALAAMLDSGRMMRGNCIRLFRVDLQFWWYYAAQLLIALLAYVDVILGLLGISLPVSGELMFFAVYILYLIANLAFAWQFRSGVETSYACCYDLLRIASPRQSIPPAPPVPKDI